MATYTSNISNSYKLELNLTQKSQSIEGNYSQVGWELFLISGGYYFSDHGAVSNVTINGTKVLTFSGKFGIGQNAKVKVGSGSIRVNHNSDGIKNFSFTADFMVNTIESYTMQSKLTVSGSMGLSTIPRASKATTLNGSTIGQQMALVIERKSADFTHTVQYSFNSGENWLSAGTGVTNNVVFTPDIANCSYFPNSASGQMLVKVITYKGSSTIGETKSTYTVKVPESLIPTFTLTFTEANAKVKEKVGAYVQGQSNVKIDISEASSLYGATIKSYKIEFDEATGTASTFTKTPFKSGELSIKASVTDTRGRTATKSLPISVMPYKRPSINKASFERANSDGSINPLGSYLAVEIEASVSSLVVEGLEKNSLTTKIKAKRKDELSFLDKAETLEEGITFKGQKVVSGIDTNFSYVFSLEVEDIFGASISIGTVPTGEVTMHWHRKSLSIGKILESLDFNLDVADKGINSDGGYYLKKTPIFYDWDFGGSNYYENLKSKWGEVPDNSSFVARIKRSTSMNTVLGLKLNSDNGIMLSLHIASDGFFVYEISGGVWAANKLSKYLGEKAHGENEIISVSTNFTSRESEGYNYVRSTLDDLGYVKLKGVIKANTTISTGAFICTMPANCRPNRIQLLALATSKGPQNFMLKTNGQLTYNGGANIVAGEWISFDGVIYNKV